MKNTPFDPSSGRVRLNQEAKLPTDGLPEPVQLYIKEIVRVYHCPIEFAIVAVFSVISSAVGKRVLITDGKYTNPLMLWFVNVAISGSNKTQPVKEVLRPLREINKENYQIYEREYNEWKSNKERDEINQPRFNQLLVGDCTEEARLKILQFSSHGILGYYPEVKGFFDDSERYNKGGFVDKLLRMFDGDDVYLNRKGEERPVILNKVFMNILGDIQPGLLKATFGSPQFMENGLNQRFLFTMPKIFEFPEREVQSMKLELVQAWIDAVKFLYRLDFTDWGIISLSLGADALYTEYFNNIQRKKAKIKETTGDGYILSVYSKLQIQAQRLAGIVHMMGLINHPAYFNYRFVAEAEMEYTIRCMDYFEQTAIEVYCEICGGCPEGSKQNLTQAQIIRDFNKTIPIVNLTKFAEGIGKNKGYVSKILKPAKND